MKHQCGFCFEWSETRPCEHCGASIEDPLRAARTELEIRDEVLDRMRGGPRAKMKVLAGDCEMSYDELMAKLTEYVNGEIEYIGLGTDTPDHAEMWDWYELITNTVVPHSKRDHPFSCSC